MVWKLSIIMVFSYCDSQFACPEAQGLWHFPYNNPPLIIDGNGIRCLRRLLGESYVVQLWTSKRCWSILVHYNWLTLFVVNYVDGIVLRRHKFHNFYGSIRDNFCLYSRVDRLRSYKTFFFRGQDLPTTLLKFYIPHLSQLLTSKKRARWSI